MLTFGIEEEFIFLDLATLEPVSISQEIQHDLAAVALGGGVVHAEFLSCQVEYASPVFTHSEEAARALWGFRTELARRAHDHGVLVAGVGTPWSKPAGTMVTENNRYAEIAESIGLLAYEHFINGLHIHVGIPDRDAGVRALNQLRRWLPVMLAMSANSPFWCGRDTSFSSWRAVQYRRWTTAGCPPAFIDAEDYDRRTQALIGIGATPDMGSISWSARLSARHRTVEIRVADAQLEPAGTLLLALLVRALVLTSLDRTEAYAQTPEMLDAALWHAARHGLSATLVHPMKNTLAAASEVVEALLEETGPALKACGDLAIVTALTERLLLVGSGADRQRQAFSRAGTRGLATFLSNAILNESPRINSLPRYGTALDLCPREPDPAA